MNVARESTVSLYKIESLEFRMQNHRQHPVQVQFSLSFSRAEARDPCHLTSTQVHLYVTE